MQFNGEYFQQIFGIIMVANVSPIFLHLYFAMLEQDQEIICKKTRNLPITSVIGSFIKGPYKVITNKKLTTNSFISLAASDC